VDVGEKEMGNENDAQMGNSHKSEDSGPLAHDDDDAPGDMAEH